MIAEKVEQYFKRYPHLKVLFFFDEQEEYAKEIEQIGKGINQNATYAKTACFVRGSKSDYIMDADINVIHSIFTNSKVETIQGAGHWLHAEKPEEFFQLVSKYLADA